MKNKNVSTHSGKVLQFTLPLQWNAILV